MKAAVVAYLDQPSTDERWQNDVVVHNLQKIQTYNVTPTYRPHMYSLTAPASVHDTTIRSTGAAQCCQLRFLPIVNDTGSVVGLRTV